MSCRMVFAEDQQLIRESLGYLLSGEPELVVEALASDGREAVELCRTLNPDLVLLDIQMPGMDGFQAAEAIRRGGSAARIVFLTTFADRSLVRRAVQFGADGFLLKDIPPDRFVLALKTIAAGLVVYQPELKSCLAAGASGETSRELPFGLTSRDRDYIRYIVDGLGNKEIARLDGCSEGTVKNRISGILNKLSLEVRTQIAVFAVRNRLLEDEPEPREW